MIFTIWASLVVGLLVLGAFLSWFVPFVKRRKAQKRAKANHSYSYYNRKWRGHFFSTFGWIAMIVLFVGGFVIAFGGVGPNKGENAGEPELQGSYSLRALVTKESDEAGGSFSYFLGFGGGSYAEGTTTTIAYIEQGKDGGSTLESASIDYSTIYEGSEKPYVEHWLNVWHDDGLWFPWPVTIPAYDDYTIHKFHIPTGTILEQYEVNP